MGRMPNENAWRDAFIVALRRTRATNDDINAELATAYDAARADGKTPKGALGDPAEYAATLGYRPKIANLAEGLAGGAMVVGAFTLIDSLRAMRTGQQFHLTVGALVSWVLVIVSVPALLWAFRRYSPMVVLGSGMLLMLVWVFLSNAQTPSLLTVDPAVPTMIALVLFLGAIAYVGRYLHYQNSHPVVDPLTGEDVRFPNPHPTFMQKWGPLVAMVAGLLVVVLFTLI